MQGNMSSDTLPLFKDLTVYWQASNELNWYSVSSAQHKTQAHVAQIINKMLLAC